LLSDSSAIRRVRHHAEQEVNVGELAVMRILPVVKAYPVIDSVSRSEAVCVAGVSIDEPHQWVRLFPLDFRGLVRAQKFHKYQVIEVSVSRSSKDSRPESFSPDLASITLGETIGTDRGKWTTRLSYLDQLTDESMCEIQRQHTARGQSLGLFRPQQVEDLKVQAAGKEFAQRQRALLSQASLTGDRAGDTTRSPLEPLPVKAKFHYRCSDPACKGHAQSLIDWELGALYANLRDGGDDEATIHAKIREKFLTQYCGPAYDTRFITGNMLKHPGSFLILGLIYPKRLRVAVPALTLFPTA
jgi:hypothetical protein